MKRKLTTTFYATLFFITIICISMFIVLYTNNYLPESIVKTFIECRFNASFENIDEYDKLRKKLVDEDYYKEHEKSGEAQKIIDFYKENQIRGSLINFNIISKEKLYSGILYKTESVTSMASEKNADMNITAEYKMNFLVQKIAWNKYIIKKIDVVEINELESSHNHEEYNHEHNH